MIEVKVNSLDEALQKSYPPWVRRTIQIPDISIYRAFSDSVEKNKDNIAIDFMGKKITYSSLKEKIDSISVRLGELGITKGDYKCIIPEGRVFQYEQSKPWLFIPGGPHNDGR